MASHRTYLIAFYWLAYGLFKYGGKWGAKMFPNMTVQQRACFDAVMAALPECLELFAPAPPVN